MTTLARIHQKLEAFGQSQEPAMIMRLFCEDLRWGRTCDVTPRKLPLGAPVLREVMATPVAQMSGLPVYRVDWPYDRLPGVTARRAVQKALTPTSTEHLTCYVTQNGRTERLNCAPCPTKSARPPAPPSSGWRSWPSASMNSAPANRRLPASPINSPRRSAWRRSQNGSIRKWPTGTSGHWITYAFPRMRPKPTARIT